METRLIMLPDPILVSGQEIKEGDWYWDTLVSHLEKVGPLKMIGLADESSTKLIIQSSVGTTSPIKASRKIIAGIEDLSKLNLSLIAEEIGWVDVRLAAQKYRDEKYEQIAIGKNKPQAITASLHAEQGWFDGFKSAQSLNEKKYSDEDLFNLLKMVHDKRLDSLSARIVDNGRVTDFNFWNSYSKKQVYASELISEFIQSLPKPKEYLVEVEMDCTLVGLDLSDSCIPKITNNTITVTKILQ